jgi:hypothetical protein
MAGQPFGTSAGRPEGVAYREVRHEHRATPLSGRAADLFTSSHLCVTSCVQDRDQSLAQEMDHAAGVVLEVAADALQRLVAVGAQDSALVGEGPRPLCGQRPHGTLRNALGPGWHLRHAGAAQHLSQRPVGGVDSVSHRPEIRNPSAYTPIGQRMTRT